MTKDKDQITRVLKPQQQKTQTILKHYMQDAGAKTVLTQQVRKSIIAYEWDNPSKPEDLSVAKVLKAYQ